MRISLNGLASPIAPRDSGTVGQAYETAVDHASGVGLTILDVRLDGRVVSDTDRARFFDRSVADFAQMDLETVDTLQLVRAALVEARNHLVPCRDALLSAHSLLAAGQHVRALRTLKPALEVWMAVCEAVTKAAILMGADPTYPISDNASIEDAQKLVVDVLERTRVTFESRDWPALGSLIQSDFLPLVARWESICRSLESRCEPTA